MDYSVFKDILFERRDNGILWDHTQQARQTEHG